MIPAAAFMDVYIVPVLLKLREADERLNSLAAARLLLGTAIMESRLTHLAQQGGGPAQGFFQIEPATFHDTYRRYLGDRRPDIKRAVDAFAFAGLPLEAQLAGNTHLGCAIARVKFWMAIPPLPDADDIDGLGAYWDAVYNCNPNVGTAAEWAALYRKHVKP